MLACISTPGGRTSTAIANLPQLSHDGAAFCASPCPFRSRRFLLEVQDDQSYERLIEIYGEKFYKSIYRDSEIVVLVCTYEEEHT